MERYSYKGINSTTNKVVRGETSATNPGELERILDESGILLINYKMVRKSILSFLSRSKLNNKELITLFTHLEQLDNAGVSIIDSLFDIKTSPSYPQKMRGIVQEIYESVKNGNLFSESLEKHPRIFNHVFIGLVANGERTGHLNIAFRSIIEHLKWSDAIKKKTIKATRYPLFSLFVMFTVMAVMTNFVVPKVTKFLTEQKLELPAMTTALISFSAFMQSYSLLIIASVPVIFVIYKILRKNYEFALAVDRIKLHIPIMGPIIKKLDASRFCSFFSITFESGIGVLDCLESSKQVVDNLAIKYSIDEIRQKVSDGQSLADAINSSGNFEGLVIRMFKVGEDSGNMKVALDNIRFFYDQEINDSIDKIVGMIQPTLIFVMGGLMLWITAAIFGPIYDSFSQMNA